MCVKESILLAWSQIEFSLKCGIKTCLLGIKRKINPCGAAVGRSYPLTVKYVFVFFISPSFLWQRDTV